MARVDPKARARVDPMMWVITKGERSK
jgi:hypothetical protein